jgi:hypothetical protein
MQEPNKEAGSNNEPSRQGEEHQPTYGGIATHGISPGYDNVCSQILDLIEVPISIPARSRSDPRDRWLAADGRHDCIPVRTLPGSGLCRAS